MELYNLSKTKELKTRKLSAQHQEVLVNHILSYEAQFSEPHCPARKLHSVYHMFSTVTQKSKNLRKTDEVWAEMLLYA